MGRGSQYVLSRQTGLGTDVVRLTLPRSAEHAAGSFERRQSHACLDALPWRSSDVFAGGEVLLRAAWTQPGSRDS